MRALVAEGAPRKALNLLVSDGLHSLDDAEVVSRLEELHPAGHPVRSQDLPGALDTKLPTVTSVGMWSKLVLKGVADFPGGSSPGTSGLRPSCLYDMLKRGPHVSTLTEALASFVAICAQGLFPTDVA